MAKDARELRHRFRKLHGVAKTLHLDIVDGKFAPNHSLDFPLKLPREFRYQAHLMVRDPLPWIRKNLNRIGLFIPHFESLQEPAQYIAWMKQRKKKVAFAILPETKVTSLKKHLMNIDIILILTVHPGFYGGKYLKSELRKIEQIKRMNPKVRVIVDGGMNPKTIRQARKAGADFFVSGSYVNGAENPRKALRQLQNIIFP